MANESAVYSFVKRKIARLDEETSWGRVMRARLRRAAGTQPGASPAIWAVTLADAPLEWYSRGGIPSFEENAVHTALTLYALHCQGKDRSMTTVYSSSSDDEKNENKSKERSESIGCAIARLINPDESNLDAVKRRFDAMATSEEFYELSYHARSIVLLLRAVDITMDYPNFARDIYMYQIPGRADSVRLRWGEDFYRVLFNNNNRKESDET